MHLLYLQEQRLRIPLGRRDTNRKEERCVTKKRSHESFKGNSTLGLSPCPNGTTAGMGRERESERGLEREKSGGKLWDDYVTVSQTNRLLERQHGRLSKIRKEERQEA